MKVQGTRLETDEEVRQALLKYRPAARPAAVGSLESAPPDDAPPLFRPTERPPTPLLRVFDDGSDKGESIRIRTDKFVIGRSEGDLLLPHDAQISGRHAELRRTFAKDKYAWQLIDLNSTNGTFVRIGHAVLEDGQEFIVGRSRLRFEHPRPDGTPAGANGPVAQTTVPWQTRGQELAPAVVLVKADGSGQRVMMTEQDLWIGKDAARCQMVLNDDPFASARHARLRRGKEGRWMIENNKSLNGVWLRIERLALTGTCRFLLGEQQFLFHIPG